MDFAKRMRIMREVRGVLQREVSEVTGISVTQLSFIENGKALPTPAMADAIKRALGWTEDTERAFAILEGEEAA